MIKYKSPKNDMDRQRHKFKKSESQNTFIQAPVTKKNSFWKIWCNILPNFI